MTMRQCFFFLLRQTMASRNEKKKNNSFLFIFFNDFPFPFHHYLSNWWCREREITLFRCVLGSLNKDILIGPSFSWSVCPLVGPSIAHDIWPWRGSYEDLSFFFLWRHQEYGMMSLKGWYSRDIDTKSKIYPRSNRQNASEVGRLSDLFSLSKEFVAGMEEDASLAPAKIRTD